MLLIGILSVFLAIYRGMKKLPRTRNWILMTSSFWLTPDNIVAFTGLHEFIKQENDRKLDILRAKLSSSHCSLYSLKQLERIIVS